MRISLKNCLGLFYIFLLSVIYVFSNPIKFKICDNKYTTDRYVGCMDDWQENIVIIATIIFLSTILFFIAIYRMKEPVFQKWFKFAVWYVPLLIVAYFLFPTSISGGLGIASGITEGFNTIILIILFSIFIITSIVKIVRAYKGSK